MPGIASVITLLYFPLAQCSELASVKGKEERKGRMCLG